MKVTLLNAVLAAVSAYVIYYKFFGREGFDLGMNSDAGTVILVGAAAFGIFYVLSKLTWAD